MKKDLKSKLIKAKLGGHKIQIWCRNGSICGIPRSCEAMRKARCQEKKPCSSAQYTEEGDWPSAKHIAGVADINYIYGPYKYE